MSDTVLVTGAAGMIGSYVCKNLLNAGFNVIGLDRCAADADNNNYLHITADLDDKEGLDAIFSEHRPDRVIHLAALAHTAGVKDLSYEAYYKINVVCAQNVFEISDKYSVPVLFISTVDVYGFVKGKADCSLTPHPITVYGKTKAMAEEKLKAVCRSYDIFRFSPVYTDEIKRDIQKRYYLKYPNVAYIIGKGTDCEFLNIKTAADKLTAWVTGDVTNKTYNIKDRERISTSECLKAERASGRAKYILRFPRWLVKLGFGAAVLLTGKNKYTYLLNKAVNPLRTE